MRAVPLLRKIDAVTIPVPDLDVGLGLYRDRLGHDVAPMPMITLSLDARPAAVRV